MASTGPSSPSAPISLSVPTFGSLLGCVTSCVISSCSLAGESARHGQRIWYESSIKVGLQYVAHDLSQSRREWLNSTFTAR